MMKIKYNGRTFFSGQSLANAITRDMNQSIGRQVRQAAAASNTSVRKTTKDFEIKGDAADLSRFYDRLGR
ncbi:hypothetical protein FNJ84_04510 [Paracoccus sp. M683]|uniref:hypothetical protein n=1 Tax=Paracoccus sp. M683 TaxID=2594268 RepID=UPI00117D1A50|nr:hypothetical protein [Paracoccus sp. M683]TRW98820.1 hypothetical protein FNJ84_04510 [Paracoccus sp. M683]